ncbi:MAG: hypothetical protein ACXIUV_10340 [Alkalilacustris sp.]
MRKAIQTVLPGAVLWLAAALWAVEAPTAAAQTVAPEAGGPAADPPQAPAAPASEPTAPRVVVTADALVRNDSMRRVLALVEVPPEAATNPVLGPYVTDTDARRLRTWLAEGRATGLAGVFYDNRDRGHSRISATRFPQLTHIVYDEELMARDADRSLAVDFLFPGPVLGNASLALRNGPQARSLPRLAMTMVDGPMAKAVSYFTNQLYVYPAHEDVRDGADLLPAMLPYFVISLGSSHLDRPVVEALAMALASMRPDTRARAEAAGLIAPTLVMLLRRTLEGVSDYLDPAAHPPAISRNRLRPGLMMTAAQALTPDTLPPVVVLTVEDEDFSGAAGLLGLDERLFDTPAAVARLWRGWEGRREMIVSTEATNDPNGRDLRIHWVLVSGDPERVRIEPLDPAGRRARIVIDWHDAPFQPSPQALARSRVEIAAIAWNGAQYSAPSFVTVAFPSHELREHAPDANGVPQLVSVDYRAAARGASFDPVLWWQAPWRDVALRDAEGRLTGWRREADGKAPVEVGLGAADPMELLEARSATPTLRWLTGTD